MLPWFHSPILRSETIVMLRLSPSQLYAIVPFAFLGDQLIQTIKNIVARFLPMVLVPEILIIVILP